MKLSDYVIDFIARQGVDCVFMVVGGGMMHLSESAGRHPKLRYVCTHHEQAAAIAAEGYARAGHKLGVALCTTGPGASNMITGTLCSWVDSVPVLVVSGQSNSKYLIGQTGLRQRGVQEADTLALVRPITKYAVMVTDPDTIRYHMEKAAWLATHGRPGPVWVDIPLDVQGKNIEPEKLTGFDPVREFPVQAEQKQRLQAQVGQVVELLKSAQRPAIVAGQGVELAGGAAQLRQLVEQAGIPVVTTKNSYDLLEYAHPSQAGMGGINGQRSANFCMQTSDLIISIGSRMDLTFVGYNTELYAPHAKIVMVDVDEKQLQHPVVRVDLAIQADAKEFIRELLAQANKFFPLPTQRWLDKVREWKERYYAVQPEYRTNPSYVNSYDFMEYLVDHLPEDALLVLDQGASYYSPTQSAKLRGHQRMFTNAGIAPMGYGLPAAVGACFARGGKEVVCVHGDGGLQLNIHELQTVIHHKLPMRLFVFNNQGYLSIKHTQKAYFQGHLVGSDPASGLSCPDLEKIAKAYGFEYEKIANSQELRQKLPGILTRPTPLFVEVMLDPQQPFVPKVQSERLADGTMVSKPLDDMYPYLDRADYQEQVGFFKKWK